jgi:hypothetical protein
MHPVRGRYSGVDLKMSRRQGGSSRTGGPSRTGGRERISGE